THTHVLLALAGEGGRAQPRRLSARCRRVTRHRDEFDEHCGAPAEVALGQQHGPAPGRETIREMHSSGSKAMRGLLALVATAAFMTGGCRTVADKMADAEHDAVASLPAGSTFVDRHVTSSSRLSHYRL